MRQLSALLLLAVLATPAPAAALSILQRALPDYRCGSRECPPSPATAIMGEPGKVLAASVEGGPRAGDLFSEVQLPSMALAPGPAGAPATAIAPGLDGNPWALGQLGDGRMALLDAGAHGASTVYAYAPGELPRALATGLGAVWVAGGGVDRLAGPTSVRSILGAGVGETRDVAVGPAGSAWATDGDGAIVQVTESGQVIERSSEQQPLEPLLRGTPGLERIAVGPDGDLWYTDWRGLIGRMSPSGEAREYAIPVHSPPYAPSAGRPFPVGIVAGPDGRMYFTDPGDDAIGTVTMAGEVTEYPIPALAPVVPRDIALAGEEVVFDESQSATLGVIDVNGSQAPLSTPPPIATVQAGVQRALLAARASAKRAFRRGAGFAVSVAPPEAGTLSLSWTAQLPAPAKRRRGKASPPRSVLVASGEQAFPLPQAGTIDVSVTAAGARLLRRSAHGPALHVTAQATFSGYWAGPVAASVGEAFR